MTSSELLPYWGGGGVLFGLFVWGVRLLMTSWSKQATEQSKATAEGKIFDMVTARLTAQDKRISELDSLVHRQAVKLTKVQMLLMRMEGLLEQHSISMPADLRSDFDELLK